MKKVDMKKLAGTSLLSLGLVVGVAGFAGASSGTIGTTGAESNNKIKHETSTEWNVDNNTDVDLKNKTRQEASSGDVEAKSNTTAGNATTGSASNGNTTNGTVEVDNSQASSGASGLMGSSGSGSGGSSNSGSISNTGYASENQVETTNRMDVDINNDTNVDIYNTTEQSAASGNAQVQYNTTGGSAVTGNASNTSSSSFTVRVTN